MPTRYEKQIDESPTVKFLRDGLSLWERANTEQTESLGAANADQRDAFARTGAVLEHGLARITLNDASLLSAPSLNGLQGPASAVHNALSAFVSTGVPSHLDTLHNQTENLAALIAQHLPPPPPGRTGPATRALNRTTERFAEVEAGLGEIEGRAEAAAVAINKGLESIEAQATAQREEQQEEYEAAFVKIKGKDEEAARMLNRVAAATLGAQYGAERDEHDKLAGPWTKLGWALLFALIAGSGLVFATMFWNLGISDIDTTSRLLRQTALFGALATGIALAFRRAAYHRRREERAKRIEDELSLLTPFIDRLDPVQQDALLYIVAPRYFLGGTPGARGPDDGATMIEMLRHVRQRASGEESSEGQSDNQ